MNNSINKIRFSLAYKSYISSSEWKKKSKAFIDSVGKCEICGSKNKLQSHHKNYRNFGCETKDDIKVLCNKCHYDVTRKRYWVKKKLGYVGRPKIYLESEKREKLYWEETYKDKIYKLLTGKNYDKI